MSEAMHTPWPWTVQIDGIGDLFVAGSNCEFVCDVGQGNDQAEHDANLIAAAPQLLAELEKAEAFMSGFEGDPEQEGIADKLASIRAVIAKAKGGAA